MREIDNRVGMSRRFGHWVAAGIVAGTGVGVGTAVLHIVAQRYLHFKLFRLALDSLQASWGQWLVIFLVSVIAVAVMVLLLKPLPPGRVRRFIVTGLTFVIVFGSVEWLLDRFWLAFRVRPIGFVFHLGVGAVSLVAAWFSVRWYRGGSWDRLSARILELRVWRRIALLCVLLFGGLHLYIYLDGRADPPSGPNVVMIVSDALRQDHLGCYGYRRPTSPHIDNFAREASRYSRAFAQASSTKPSVASLFTSLYPSQHRTIYNEDALPASCLTLAEVLKQHRYATAGFAENFNISGKFGFHHGFDTWYQRSSRLRQTGPQMERFDREIDSWLKGHRRERFFLYVHFLDPHNPYTAPPPFYNHFDRYYSGKITGKESGPQYIAHYRQNRRDLEHLEALYDDEIRFIDSRFDRLIRTLRRLDLLENSIVIFLSDHGEEFLDHGHLRHATSVYAELINIPLIIRYPKLFPRREEPEAVQHIDLFPTLLAALNIDHRPLPLEGNNILLRGAAGGGSGNPNPVVSEYLKFRRGKAPPQRCLIHQEWKLVHHLHTDTYSLFNIRTDPTDSIDLIDRRAGIAARLKSRLAAWQRHLHIRNRGSKVRLDEEAREKLRSLGYIN